MEYRYIRYDNVLYRGEPGMPPREQYVDRLKTWKPVPDWADAIEAASYGTSIDPVDLQGYL